MRMALMAFAAAVMALGSTSTAQAQASPEQVARACIGHIQQAAHRTVGAIRESTMAAVARIQHLDENGAPDSAIVHAGREAVERLNGIARHGCANVRDIAAHCIHRLHGMGASHELIAMVRAAAERACASIESARDHGVRAIHHAVQEATR